MFWQERQVLDPIERVSEVLFGLIMVLTFTGSLSVASPERSEVREMLVGAIGCNLAWVERDAEGSCHPLVEEGPGRLGPGGGSSRHRRDVECFRRGATAS